MFCDNDALSDCTLYKLVSFSKSVRAFVHARLPEAEGGRNWELGPSLFLWAILGEIRVEIGNRNPERETRIRESCGTKSREENLRENGKLEIKG